MVTRPDGATLVAPHGTFDWSPKYGVVRVRHRPYNHDMYFLTQYRHKHPYVRVNTHRYKRTHADPTPMSTFERVGQHMILRFYEVTIGAS